MYEYILTVYGRHIILNEKSRCKCIDKNQWWQEDWLLPFDMDNLSFLEEIIRRSYRKHYYSIFSWGFDNQVYYDNDNKEEPLGNIMFFDIDNYELKDVFDFVDYMMLAYGDKLNLEEPMINKTNKGFHVIFFKVLPFEDWVKLLYKDKIIRRYVDDKFIRVSLVRNGNVLRFSPKKYGDDARLFNLIEGKISDDSWFLIDFKNLLIKILNAYHGGINRYKEW